MQIDIVYVGDLYTYNPKQLMVFSRGGIVNFAIKLRRHKNDKVDRKSPEGRWCHSYVGNLSKEIDDTLYFTNFSLIGAIPRAKVICETDQILL